MAKASEKKFLEEQAKQERKWRAESDLRTLIEAEKIRKDKTRFDPAMEQRQLMLDDLNNIEVTEDE